MRFGVCVSPGVGALFLGYLEELGLVPDVVCTTGPSKSWPRRLLQEAVVRLPKAQAKQRCGGEPWILAHAMGWPVMSWDQMQRPEGLKRLQAMELDYLLVFGFPVLPPQVLTRAGKGVFGLHPSVLPRHRGAAPLFWTLRAQERNGGYTIFRLTSKVDGGPVLERGEVPLATDDDAESALAHVARIGGKAFARFALRLATGWEPPHGANPMPSKLEPKPKPQDVTIAPGLRSSELRALVAAGRHLGGAVFGSVDLGRAPRVVELLTKGEEDWSRLRLRGGRSAVSYTTLEGDEYVLIVRAPVN